MIATLVTSYGYFAVFAGTLLEGETLLIAAGFAAHRGLLAWPLVVLVAIAGATLGDLSAFLIGRWKGDVLIARFPSLLQRKPKIHALLERYDWLFILAFRFMYGMRIAGPLILGSSQVSLLRFMVFNMLGATLWAMLVSGAGYGFALVINAMIGDVKRLEEIVLLVILALGASLWLWRWSRAKLSSHEREGK